MKLSVSQILEVVALLSGVVGVATAGAIHYLGLNLGLSSTAAAVCGIVPMVGLLGLALALRDV